MKYGGGHLLEDERQKTADNAEEKAEHEAQNKTPFVRLHIAVEATIWSPAKPDRLEKRGLRFFLGLILHTADAAGADNIEPIASITAAVEMSFIGRFPSSYWKSRLGSGEFPNKIAAGLFRGRQWNGLVGPNRITCGVFEALARCIGAESTVTNNRAFSTKAARVSKSSWPERSTAGISSRLRMAARCRRSVALSPPDNTGRNPSSCAVNVIAAAQRSISQNLSARAEPG